MKRFFEKRLEMNCREREIKRLCVFVYLWVGERERDREKGIIQALQT